MLEAGAQEKSQTHHGVGGEQDFSFPGAVLGGDEYCSPSVLWDVAGDQVLPLLTQPLALGEANPADPP